MLIRDLPDDVKELALKNQELQGNTRDENADLDDDRLRGNFDWINTDEGERYWDDASFGKYDDINDEIYIK